MKKVPSHYDNTPMQYAAISKVCKNGIFQMKNCDIFLIFAQNIDCGYTLEPEKWSFNKAKLLQGGRFTAPV